MAFDICRGMLGLVYTGSTKLVRGTWFGRNQRPRHRET